MVIFCFILFLGFLLSLLLTILLERLILAYSQNRLGPSIVGFVGLLQALIDGLKTFLKSIIHLKRVQKVIFIALPSILLFTNFIRLFILPVSTDAQLLDFLYDLLVFYAVSGIDAVVFILISWISIKTKFSRLSAVRELTQLCAVEVVSGLCFLALSLHAGSLNMRDCISTQSHIWFICVLAPYAVLFFITILVQLHRTPFDTTEAEAELTAGYQTELGGILFSIFYLSEYLGIIISCFIFSNLFLGGWYVPYLGGKTVFLIIKVLVLMALVFFIRAALPRVRIQALLINLWNYVVPAAVAILPAYAIIANAFSCIKYSNICVWTKATLVNFIESFKHHNPLPGKAVGEMDIRLDTSLANFIHSPLVNPETGPYMIQTKRLFNNNAGIGFTRFPYDHNLSTLLQIASLNTIEGRARLARSPLFCHNVHIWKYWSIHELFKGLFSPNAFTADESEMPSLSARLQLQHINSGIGVKLKEEFDEAISSGNISTRYLNDRVAFKNTVADFKKTFSTPYRLVENYGLNNLGTLHAVTLKTFKPQIFGLPGHVDWLDISRQVLPAHNRENVAKTAFGDSNLANMYNSFYGWDPLPDWTVKNEKLLKQRTFKNEIILGDKPRTSDFVRTLEQNFIDKSLQNLDYPKCLKNTNTNFYINAMRHGAFFDETSIDGSLPQDRAISPRAQSGFNPNIVITSKNGISLGSSGHTLKNHPRID